MAGRRDASNRYAIILRGTTGVGKTEVGINVLKMLGYPKEQLVSLDRGWVPGEMRFTPGLSRYSDIRNRFENVLIIELAWGEPTGEQSLGATKNPNEWADILRTEGREVHLYLLWAEWFAIESRIQKRGRSDITVAKKMYKQYQSHVDYTEFSKRIGIEEEQIDTTYKTPEEIAKYIYNKIFS